MQFLHLGANPRIQRKLNPLQNFWLPGMPSSGEMQYTHMYTLQNTWLGYASFSMVSLMGVLRANVLFYVDHSLIFCILETQYYRTLKYNAYISQKVLRYIRDREANWAVMNTKNWKTYNLTNKLSGHFIEPYLLQKSSVRNFV